MGTPEETRRFFDALAQGWDERCRHDEAAVGRIVDALDVRPGLRVLDVACGTGVLVPRYLERGAASVCAVDISPNMICVARRKFADEVAAGDVSFVVADAQDSALPACDRAMLFDAFPHFGRPEALFANLATSLRPAGRFVLAHDADRAAIDGCHTGAAARVSRGLPPASELAERLGRWFDVDLVVDEDVYVVSGTRHG